MLKLNNVFTTVRMNSVGYVRSLLLLFALFMFAVLGFTLDPKLLLFVFLTCKHL